MSIVKKISLSALFSTLLLVLSACGGETPDRSIQPQLDEPLVGAATEAESTTEEASDASMTRVLLSTNRGPIELALDEEKAPLSVANFLAYVDSGHFEDTIFHRVIPGFMIQGGGFTLDYAQKPTQDPIKNEATNGLKNVKYSIAMARTGVVDSATAQFFINVVDNGFLDHRDTSTQGFGYAVFGKVVEGFEVVDAIAALQTGSGGRFRTDVPVEPVVIQSITRK